jgi:hypothetical protein
MQTLIIVSRYRSWSIPFAFISMAIFHIPLMFNKKILFYKLMGSGKNGTFDIIPDLKQWVMLININDQSTVPDEKFVLGTLGKFIRQWMKWFVVETGILVLKPMNGHGLWDGKMPFEKGEKQHTGSKYATLTRATIRLTKLGSFWRQVAPVAATLSDAKGFCFSLGFGEVPWVKQATFSVWNTEQDLINFAYHMKEHKNVIQQTRAQNWYSEELFFRFEVLTSIGTFKGKTL